MDLQVAILQVAVGTTRNGKQKFTVSCGDGQERTVWEAGLANAINAFAGSGQPVTIREEVSQNGQYTNRTIRAFAPPGQVLPPEQAGGGTGGGGGGFQRGGGGRGSMTPEDKTRIAKQGAMGVAAQVVAALFMGAGPEAYAEAVSLHEQLTRKLYTESRSHEKPGQDGPQVLQPGAAAIEASPPLATNGAQVLQPGASPQAVAAAVPGVVLGTQALAPGGAADATAAADVQAQAASESGDSTIEWD